VNINIFALIINQTWHICDVAVWGMLVVIGRVNWFPSQKYGEKF